MPPINLLKYDALAYFILITCEPESEFNLPVLDKHYYAGTRHKCQIVVDEVHRHYLSGFVTCRVQIIRILDQLLVHGDQPIR